MASACVSVCVCHSVCHNYLFSQHKQLAAGTRSCHPTNLHAISSRTLHSSTMASLLLAWSTTLPSCQAANQLSEVTNCKLRQHCYDSFCNQQLSSDGKSAQWASREMGKGRIAAAREEEECERRISAAVHQCLRAQTLLPIRILLSQQPRIVGLKQKAMQSECTHLMFALAFPVTSCQLPVTSYQLLLLPLCTQTCHSWRGEQCGQTMIVESKSDGCEYTS